MSVFSRIRELLDSNGIKYKVIEHEPVYTSEQAAIARKESIKIGAKSLILKANDFFMVVISGAKKIDMKKLRKFLNVKSLRFATPEEVKELTTLEIGAIPPFGNLFSLRVYVDKDLLKNKEIAFNAGLHDKSIKLNTKDYIRLVKPEIGEFS